MTFVRPIFGAISQEFIPQRSGEEHVQIAQPVKLIQRTVSDGSTRENETADILVILNAERRSQKRAGQEYRNGAHSVAARAHDHVNQEAFPAADQDSDESSQAHEIEPPIQGRRPVAMLDGVQSRVRQVLQKDFGYDGHSTRNPLRVVTQYDDFSFLSGGMKDMAGSASSRNRALVMGNRPLTIH